MFTSINPATGAEFATYPEMDSAEVELRVSKAVSAFKSWRRSSLAERQAVLSKIADNFEANKHRLAEMASLEMGQNS